MGGGGETHARARRSPQVLSPVLKTAAGTPGGRVLRSHGTGGSPNNATSHGSSGRRGAPSVASICPQVSGGQGGPPSPSLLGARLSAPSAALPHRAPLPPRLRPGHRPP
ncbi:hypothetical protein NDU88_005711 [Pleurodeles waltl]|uniref:Uncharacterized protein n=1 Tax=Pleurodeles waltl TaxID=8319 RepID=A0AAV7LLZ0_PLEWA|nr:hypothetical protein NDU88_005711 [Pleurodeles waltl]